MNYILCVYLLRKQGNEIVALKYCWGFHNFVLNSRVRQKLDFIPIKIIRTKKVSSYSISISICRQLLIDLSREWKLSVLHSTKQQRWICIQCTIWFISTPFISESMKARFICKCVEWALNWINQAVKERNILRLIWKY